MLFTLCYFYDQIIYVDSSLFIRPIIRPIIRPVMYETLPPPPEVKFDSRSVLDSLDSSLFTWPII